MGLLDCSHGSKHGPATTMLAEAAILTLRRVYYRRSRQADDPLLALGFVVAAEARIQQGAGDDKVGDDLRLPDVDAGARQILVELCAAGYGEEDA